MKQTLNNEAGAVLITGLMILVVLSLLGITTLQTSTLEEKMANNMSQRQLAFQAAEAGLREAEARLTAEDPTLPILTPAGAGADPLWETPNRWTTTNAVTGSQVGAVIPGGAQAWRYIAEFLQDLPDPDADLSADAPVSGEIMFRITSRGVGGLNTADVILQVTHLREL